MILYLSVIFFFMTCFVIFNYFIYMPVYGFTLEYNILAVVVSAVAVIAIDGLIAYLARCLQEKYNPFSKYFSVKIKQKNFYEKIGVKRYKDFIPDLGKIAGFSKAKIEEPKSKEYVLTYMKETCSGEVGHFISMFAGFLIIFIFPLKYALFFGVPVGVVNLILNFLPVITLRYNRYKLNILYRRLERKESL